MEFWHKKPFSIRFVHKSRKLSNFEPTVDYVMLRNFRTVRPIFPKIAPKVAQDFKEKRHESSRREKKIPRNYRAKCRGGGGADPPPGPFRVKAGQTNAHIDRQNNTHTYIYTPYKHTHATTHTDITHTNTHTHARKEHII